MMFKQRILLFLALLVAGGVLLLARLYFTEPEQQAQVAATPQVLDVGSDEFFRFCMEYQIDCRTANGTDQLGYFLTFLEQELIYRQSFDRGMPWHDPVVQRLLLSNQEYLDIEQLTPELLDELVMSDAAIRRHVVRRMRHLLSYPEITEPSREELRAYHAANADQFTTPARLSLRQLRFNTPNAATQALALAQESGNDPVAARVSSLPSELTMAGQRDLARYFGTVFADRVFALAAAGERRGWQGPVASGLGHHLVLISAYRPDGLAPFDDAIMNQVQGRWLNEQREIVYRRRVDAMKENVQVSLNGSDPVPLHELNQGDLSGAL
ncbi:MAG: peptidyl-prolyl cis-trans isomerase [Halioglobus sp.]|nr:peptidyl-prolyl cis-trans isomerase [Halioglobus sp.]